MINTNNLCLFEGRMTKSQTSSQVNGANGPIDKLVFSISVPRILTSKQKDDRKAGVDVKSNDFVRLSLLGPRVKTIQQYFPAGTPIKVVAKYTEYTMTDPATGQKTYGHNFEVEDFGFVVSPSQDTGQNNYQQQGNNYNQQAPAANNYQQAPQNNYQKPQHQAQQGNFALFGEDDIEQPF